MFLRYMNESNTFSSNQSGFRCLHSTLICLLRNTDDWHSGLDLDKLVGLVFIYLKKAFDIIDHDILCQNSITTVHSNVSYYGFNPAYLTGKSFTESMGLIRKSIV